MPLWLIILLGIVGIVALLMVAPVVAVMTYDGAFRVAIRYLIVTYRPPLEKEKPEKEKKRAKKKEKPPEEEKKPFDFEQLRTQIEEIWGMVKAAAGPVGWLLGKTVVRRIRTTITVGGGDAAAIGEAYGRLNAYVYGGLAALRNFVRVRRCDIRLLADFLAPKTTGEAEIRISWRMGELVWTVLWAGVRILAGMRDAKSQNTPAPPSKMKPRSTPRPKKPAGSGAAGGA